MTQVVPFVFEQHTVRVVTIDGEPWFVAADVLSTLILDRKALERLDDDEKGVNSIHTPGGQQEMTVVNESGLYSLILGSRKPEAKKFKKWVTVEVLPTIRKTGAYLAPGTLSDPIRAQIGGIVKSVVANQISLAISDVLPSLVDAAIAKQRVGVRHGVTAGQVWSQYGLPKLKNGPQALSGWLVGTHCQIDGEHRGELGGKTAKLFCPDKVSRAMKSGVLDRCRRYVQERKGQGSLFGLRGAAAKS